MGKLRFGVVGATGGRAGGWARKIADWSRLEVFDIELVAICDINKTAVERRGVDLGCEAYVDYEEMYKKAKLDCVVIGTPHYLHAPMTVAAAEHDINVFTEKPMCINLKQADEMRRAVLMNDIKLAVGFQHRFDSSYRGFKAAIDSGDLGSVYQLNMFFRDWRTEMYYQTSTRVKDPRSGKAHGWRGHWSTEGAGALSNQLIHFLDLYQWFAPSPIKSVSAISRVAKHMFTEVDDNTNAILEFEDGSMGNIQAGVSYEYGGESEFGAYGTEGGLVHRKNMMDKDGKRVPYIDYRSKAMQEKKPLKSYMPGGFDSGMDLFANFVEAVEEDDASIISCNVHEGRKSIELMRGILMSIILEKKVTFPLHDSADMFPSLAHTYKDPNFEY